MNDPSVSMEFLDGLDLSSLKHGRSRDGASITNVEFIVLYLTKNGPTRWKELQRALCRWRGIDGDARPGQYSIYFHGDGMYCKGYRGRTPDEDGKFWWHADIRTGHWDRVTQKYVTTYNAEARKSGFQLTARGAVLASYALARIYAHVNKENQDG